MSVIAVWFSCGAASAIAAKETLRRYGDTHTVQIINNPVAEEHDDNRRFLRDVADWLGVGIEKAYNEKYPSASAEDVWEHRQYISGIAGAPCTIELKKEARRQWEERNEVHYHVLGFTADEQKRFEQFQANEWREVLPVLIEAGYTKQACYDELREAGISPPYVYELGLPNANCLGCVKATSPTYWNHIRKHFPEVFERRAAQSRRIGARLVRHKGERIFLDELPEDAKGKPLKSMDIECGLFCRQESDDDG